LRTGKAGGLQQEKRKLADHWLEQDNAKGGVTLVEEKLKHGWCVSCQKGTPRGETEVGRKREEKGAEKGHLEETCQPWILVKKRENHTGLFKKENAAPRKGEGSI